jgi:hypothetical protein
LGTKLTNQNCIHEEINGRLGVLENRVLRKMFVSKTEEVTVDFINCIVYASLYFAVRLITSSRMN